MDPTCWLLSCTVVCLSLLTGIHPCWSEEMVDNKLAAWKADIAKNEQEIGKRFVPSPQGETYHATVPDTLDLARRAELAINCLTGALDPDYGYELFFVAQFAANPPIMFHEASGLPTNNPKFAESLPMMRLMSGSTQNLDIEKGMMERILAMIHTDGLYYAPIIGRPWHQTWDKADDDFANVYGNGRLLLALLAWYQYDGNPMWMDYAKQVVRGLTSIARVDGDYAYFPDPKIGESFSYSKSGYPSNLPEPTDYGFGIHMYHSGVIRGLSKYAKMTGDQNALTLAGKMAKWISQPKMWGVNTESAAIASGEKGHFGGHFHAHVASLRGILEYALVANDNNLKEFARNGYDYARNYGIALIGWFPENCSQGQHCESCCIADMVGLAAKLSEAGIGDYWDDVDRYSRNQLVEQQFISHDLLQTLAEHSPASHAEPPVSTSDRVIDRNIGGFAGHGDLDKLPNSWIMHCCTGNATQALFYAWDNIVKDNGKGAIQVNLLLNRASPWVDIDSWLPYEGKILLHNKTAKSFLIRIPSWTRRDEVKCKVNSKEIEPLWAGNYILVGVFLKPNDIIEITFPVVDWTSRATLEGDLYTLSMRGNTLVSFTSTAGKILTVVNGKLVVPDSGRPVLKDISVQDVKVSVDAKNNAEAGIMLRIRNINNFILAIYANKSIYFHEVVNGNYGGQLDGVPAADLGENITLTALASGPDVTLTVTDGIKTLTTKHRLQMNPEAGQIGLFHNNSPAQYFGNLCVTDPAGKLLFADRFDSSDASTTKWTVLNGRSTGGLYDYPIYQREGMKNPEVKMVDIARFVLGRHIED
jgi:hypothetical protein